MGKVTKSSAQFWQGSFLTAVLGGALGIAAKLSDESALANNLGINDLGTYLGLWVVLATVISVLSSSQRVAVFRVTPFFLAMVTAYYIVTNLLFGFFPLNYFLGWLAIALFFSPLFAILVWYARQSNWLAVLGTALPVGFLLWEAYSLRFRFQFHLTQLVFDLVAASTLFFVLSKENIQRVRIIVLTPIVMVMIEFVNRLVPYIIGAIR